MRLVLLRQVLRRRLFFSQIRLHRFCQSRRLRRRRGLILLAEIAPRTGEVHHRRQRRDLSHRRLHRQADEDRRKQCSTRRTLLGRAGSTNIAAESDGAGLGHRRQRVGAGSESGRTVALREMQEGAAAGFT